MFTVDRTVFRGPFGPGDSDGWDASEAAEQIRRVIRVELDDVEIAIKADNKSKALDELDDAVRKLKRIANGSQ